MGIGVDPHTRSQPPCWNSQTHRDSIDCSAFRVVVDASSCRFWPGGLPGQNPALVPIWDITATIWAVWTLITTIYLHSSAHSAFER